jgi:hypothetical protein
MSRVVCRLALGKGFDATALLKTCSFSVLNSFIELGWRRIGAFVDPLPESAADKDFTRVTRLGANEEIGVLVKTACSSSC